MSVASLDLDDGDTLSGIDVAALMIEFLRKLLSLPDGEPYVRTQVDVLTSVYRRADPQMRHRLDTFIIEHLLEEARFEPLFREWTEDPTLRPGYLDCLAWGIAHRRE